MQRRLVRPLLAVVAATLAASCASGTSTATTSGAVSAGAASAAPAPSAHTGHDMTGMASRKAAELAFLFPDGDDRGWSKIENGAEHATPPDVPLAQLPAPVRAEVVRQLGLTLDVVKKYPTVKDAEAAGYRRAGPFLPGLGTHYVGGRNNRTGTLTDADILAPSTIIYDGNAPDSPIAGFMYMSVAVNPNAKPPEGFAGPNDHWHYHTGLCMTGSSNGTMEALGFDGSITEASCKAKGGNFMPITQYMLHVWTAPAYTNALGVFAHVNPAIVCKDGTYHMDEHDITNACRG
jgi:hypothetical protein